MESIRNYLSQFREPMPEWLHKYQPGDVVPFAEFMSSRFGYYPGSGSDGQLIKLCNQAHCVHSFIYVDYLLTFQDLQRMLYGSESIYGYHIIGQQEYSLKDLLPDGVYPIFVRRKVDPTFFLHDDTPYCHLYIWERDSYRDDNWGAERIATVFMSTDGIATYYQLFVMQYRKAPWIMLLQDHGFGCNYHYFGRNSMMEEFAVRFYLYPEFILWGEGGRGLWDGYEQLKCEPDMGGMLNNVPRYLCKRDWALPGNLQLWNRSIVPKERPGSSEIIFTLP